MKGPLLLGQVGQERPELLGPWEDMGEGTAIQIWSWEGTQICIDALSHVSSAGTKIPSNKGEKVGGGGSNEWVTLILAKPAVKTCPQGMGSQDEGKDVIYSIFPAPQDFPQDAMLLPGISQCQILGLHFHVGDVNGLPSEGM